MKNLIAAAALAAAVSGPALGQSRELIQLQADVITLTQRVAEMQRSLDERNAVVQRLVEQMLDRIVELGAAVDRIDMAVDAVQSSNDRVGGEMRLLMSGLRQDVDVISRSVGDLRAEVGTISQQITALNTSSGALGSPASLLRTAHADFLAGDYQLAMDGFREFIATYPSSPEVPEAQLYVGNAYYNQQQFEQAIIEYDLLLQNYPESDKRVNALLMKGLALAALGQNEDAAAVLQQVVSEFPDTPEALQARQKIEDLGAG